MSTPEFPYATSTDKDPVRIFCDVHACQLVSIHKLHIGNHYHVVRLCQLHAAICAQELDLSLARVMESLQGLLDAQTHTKTEVCSDD